MTAANHLPLRQFRDHRRNWRDNFYVYPVISRRSGGLSIGLNLNPDTACNFDCVYCQVDRTGEPRVREVDVARLGDELSQMIGDAQSGTLFDDPAFLDVSPDQRTVKDVAFSGDGEPTTCVYFPECVELVAQRKRQAGLEQAKIVLITDACYLTKPRVVEALAVMDQHNGQIWAKLDAGTEAYYQKINRPNYPLRHVMANIIAAAGVRPVVIQSLFMRLHGVGPAEAELAAFVDRLQEITQGGGKIDHVQVYTVARRPTESYVTPLSDEEVETIARLVERHAQVRVRVYYGAGTEVRS